jgi:hypothetical protein
VLTGTSVVNAWVFFNKHYPRTSVSITKFKEVLERRRRSAKFKIYISRYKQILSERKSRRVRQIIEGKRGQRTMIEPTATKPGSAAMNATKCS